MKFPADHAEYPNQPKGIKVILTECGLCRYYFLSANIYWNINKKCGGGGGSERRQRWQ
jgi:hypothetical protein